MKCVCSECACSADFLRPFMDRIQVTKNEGTYITRWLCEECHHFYSFQKQLERWDAQTKGDTPPPPSEPLPDQGESGPLTPGAGGTMTEADAAAVKLPPAKREGGELSPEAFAAIAEAAISAPPAKREGKK